MAARAVALALAIGVFALTVRPRSAHADKRTSIKLYEKGKRQYRKGEFDAALVNFLQAYSEHPAKEYLFNIAQTFRMLDDCERALDYYRRFVAEEPPPEARALADEHIALLDARCGSAAGSPTPPQEAVVVAPPPEPAPAPAAAPTVDAGKSDPAISARATPGSVSVGLGRPFVLGQAGLALTGAGEIDTPVVAAVRVGGGYPVTVGALELFGGASLELSPMRYREAEEGTALFSTLVAFAGVSYPVVPRWRVSGELGIGDTMLSGLGTGNPFTEGGAESGVLHMLSLRMGIGGSFQIDDRLSLQASPVVLSYGAGNSALASDIGSVVRWSVLAGISYSL